MSTVPAIYDTVVTHVRSAPVRNGFSYKSTQWLVDLDDLPRMPWYARALASFDARDHLTGSGSLRQQVDALLTEHRIDLDGGRVLMLANPRTLGHVFNPLSVHWCYRRDGSLAAVIAEVHNTYGERHAYLVETDERGRAETEKAFYVSPFFDTAGRYTMSLPQPGAELQQVVTLHRDGEPPFVASVRGTARPADVRGLLHALRRCPGASLGLALKIRVQGVRLWVHRVPVVARPSHDPLLTVSRSGDQRLQEVG